MKSKLTLPVPLSPTQARICALVLRGFGDKEIAAELGMTFCAVRQHWERTFKSCVATGVDNLAPKITVQCMTLLQTRVDDGTARRFERAAKERGITPYSYLQALVKDAAAAPEPRTWASRRKWRDAQGMTPVPYGIVAQQREESGER